MPRYIEPPSLPRRPGRQSHALLIGTSFKRLILAPQSGARPDGSYDEKLEAQLEQGFDKLLAVLAAAGMESRDVVRLSICTTVRGAAATCAEIREAKLGAVKPVCVYREVMGFADAGCLVEIEGEAVREA